MKKCSLILLLFFGFIFSGKAQVTDTTDVESAVAEDTVAVPIVIPENGLKNPKAISKFLKALQQRETDGFLTDRVHVFHIGDSHIQADLQTDKTRTLLQETYGNGGRGFIFPHRLARTNGSSDVSFESANNFSSQRIINGSNAYMGLSGISFSSKERPCAVKVSLKDSSDAFDLVRIVQPKSTARWQFSAGKTLESKKVIVPKPRIHKIKDGEVLGSIARKYGISVSQLKKMNRLKSDRIRAGKTLIVSKSENRSRSVKKYKYATVDFNASETWTSKEFDQALQFEVFTDSDDVSALNGFMLENSDGGIIYSSVGVNGAKFSDYNQSPLFFQQLLATSPDLLVLSLGTNESFDHQSASTYINHLTTFIQNCRSIHPDIEILVCTPPPSLFKRRYKNTYVESYANALLLNAELLRYAVWDGYTQLGGGNAVSRNYKRGLMAADRVHYSKLGYEIQGTLLAEAIIRQANQYAKSVGQ